jgi:TusA-related sulfurtransferase
LEGTGCEYSFNGSIDGTRCRVNLGKLKNFTNLMESGKIRLEVIADDTLFVPYESTYEIEESKSVTVEVFENQSTAKKTMVEVKVDTPTNQKSVIKPVAKPKNHAVNELRTYFRKYTSFDGTLKDFQRLMKDQIHKNFFNVVCENYKLDKLSVIKEILK